MVRDDARIASVCEALARAQCDALVCSQPRHVLLLGGYWPLLGSAWAIARRDGRVLLVVPEDELDLARAGWADDVLPFRAVSLDRLDRAQKVVREPLARALESARAIGFEHDASLQPATYAAQLAYGAAGPAVIASAAPGARLEAADAWLEELRARKTPAELERMRASCDVARRAYERAARAIGPGVTEREVAALFASAFETELPPGARGHAFFFCMSGANAAESRRAFQRSRARRLERGDAVIVHCNSVLDGFWTDLTRTFVLGERPELAERLAAIAEARAAAIAAVSPGVPAREVDAAARRVLDARGFGDEFRTPTGHGVGFAAIDHDAAPRLHPLSTDTLDVGMTFNVEPGLYRDGRFGLRHCDMIAVAPGGAEVLTPFQLPV